MVVAKNQGTRKKNMRFQTTNGWKMRKWELRPLGHWCCYTSSDKGRMQRLAFYECIESM
jgi:hypothetical protein